MNQEIPQRHISARPNHVINSNLHSLGSLLATYKRTMLLIAFICFLCSSMQAQWTQVWGDEFDGSANTTYDHTKWWNEVSTTAVWGDGTIQATSDSLQNAYLDGNSHLVIAMTYNAAGNSAGVQYTSARLHSVANIGPYGKIDVRIMNPPALGMGAAFWALGSNIYAPGTHNTTGGVPWPWCGELDMMEIQSQTSGHNGSTIHGGQTDGGTSYEYGGISATVDLPSGQSFDNSYHIFTTQWAPYHLQYFLDGVLYGDVNLASIGTTDIWPLTAPINFIISSGVGGNGGTPNGTGFPSNLVVDYVHYSQWANGAPAPVTGLTSTATNSNAVTLNWVASPTSDVTYNIYASTVQGTAPSLSSLIEQGATGTSFVHTGLQPGTTYYYTVVASNWGGESNASNTTVTTPAPGNSTGLQMSAGGYAVGSYMNSEFVLGGSTNFHYGNTVDTSMVTNPAPQLVYDSERWGAAAWTITGLNPRGGYNVRLHFVETAHTAAGQRAFNVSINSQTVLNNFDIYATAGGANRAVTQQFYTLADENGIIELQTQFGNNGVADLNPSISAIEITPATGSNPVGALPGTTTDLAINSGGAAVGNFVADEDFNGGDVATTTNTINVTGIANAAPVAVYQSQRYVPFTYILTGLAAGATYNVNLHFAETYWTTAGSRVFNVAINGKQVLANFDVFAQAGINTAVVKQFSSNADMYGQIIVQLIYGGADQPFINGIEAIQTSGAIGAPSGLTAAVSGSAIKLNWTASSTSGVTYSIYRGVSGTSPAVLTSNVSATTYTDSAVSSGTTYQYYVEAVKGVGVSAPSNTVTISNASTCSAVPSVPGTPSANATSSSQISLNWGTSTAGAGCTVSYNVFRSTTTGFTPASGNQVASSLASTSFADSGLAASTAYYYKVEAADVAGSSAASAQATATTQNPGTVTDIVAINSGGPATGTYAADEYFGGGGAATTTNTITTTGVTNPAPMAVYQSERAGVFSYTIPGLTSGTSYTVRLHFAEFYFTQAGQRVFNVSINGTSVLTNFDIFVAAGGANKAVVQQFTATANTSGQIVINFTNGSADQPKVSGIEIASGTATAPTITTQPAAQTVGVGSTATFSVVATGTGTVTYQWQKNSTNISGATAASYTTPATVAGDNGALFRVVVTNAGGSVTSNTALLTVTSTAALSINSGGAATGSFIADTDFSGGGTASTTNTITTTGVTNAAPAVVYQSERAGVFTYTLPGFTAGSSHTVTLHFAEFYWTKAGQRVFNVSINGNPVLTNFDIFALAGANKALVEQFTATANSSGQIVVSFAAGTADQPKVSGIQVQ